MSASPAHQITTTLAHYAELLEARHLLADSDGISPRSAHQDDGDAAGSVRADLGDIAISYVSCDSRDVRPHTLFICKGAAFKAAYLAQAIDAGAVAYVARSPFDGPDVPDSVRALPHLIVSDIRGALGAIADAAWDHPSGKLDIAAFTGTKGKTTSAWCLRAIMDERARRLKLPRTPLFSTILLDDGIASEPATLTTPEPLDLEHHLANAASTGAGVVVMEASSQALKYARMAGVELAVAAFTNISEDHISPIEHPTFEDYFSSKLRIFEHAKTAVINSDMQPDLLERVRGAARACGTMISFGVHDPHADLRATGITHDQGMLAFTLRIARTAPLDGIYREATRRDGAVLQDGSVGIRVRLSMLGAYNVENALAAIACSIPLGAALEDILAGLAAVQVPGRMQLLCNTDQLAVLVDYAHNGGALEALLDTVRGAYPGRAVTCVFGATGTKGTERRYGMGTAAGRLADRIVITTDDPGQEDPADIAAEIERCAREAGATDVTTILDRTEAITEAITRAARSQAPHVVVLAGKGHEQFMILGSKHEPYDGDIAVAKRVLAGLGVPA